MGLFFPIFLHTKGEKKKQNSPLNHVFFWKYSVRTAPSLNPKHFDCLWVIHHTGYFLLRLKRITGTGFCTLWKQGKGKGDQFQPEEQEITHGLPFWDIGRNQLPIAKQHCNSRK